MTLTILGDFLAAHAFVFIATFARVGTMIMILPGFSSSSVPARIRLLIALSVSALMVPLLVSSFPPVPASPMGLATAIVLEILIGIAIGLSARLFFSALQVAGTLIAFQSGLAFAQNFDPSQDSQGVITGSFLSVVAVTLIFVTDLHHLLIAVMRDSYVVFAPVTVLPIDDFMSFVVTAVSQSFLVGLQLAMPVMAAGFIIYVATGVLAKLIPQVQVFFVIMPANILVGFAIMFLVLSAMMIWFMDRFEQHLLQFLA